MKRVLLVFLLFSFMPLTARSAPNQGELEKLAPKGDWVSSADRVHFLLDMDQYFTGVISFNCAPRERKARLTALPSGRDNVRAISNSKKLEWDVSLKTRRAAFVGVLVGGGGQLPMVLFEPDEFWAEELGDEGEFFEISIDDRISYTLPTSPLISTTIKSCLSSANCLRGSDCDSIW